MEILVLNWNNTKTRINLKNMSYQQTNIICNEKRSTHKPALVKGHINYKGDSMMYYSYLFEAQGVLTCKGLRRS